MAVPTGTFTAHQAVGNREDLEDIIWDISPTEYPFTSAMEKVKAKAVSHEWQTDELASPGTNAQIDGDDAPVNTVTPTVRPRNYCQILSKTARVSGTQEEVDKAGRESEMAYQVRRRMEEIRRDFEWACVRNQDSTAGTAASARRLAGAESWLASNKSSVGTGTAQTTPGYANGVVASPTDSTVTGTLTAAVLKSVIQSVWNAGGNGETIMVSGTTKTKTSTLTGIATLYKDVPKGKQGEITTGADVFVSDFGNHKIVPNRYMRDATLLVLDMDYWAVAQLRPLRRYDLAKTGDSDRKQLIMEATLVCRNEKASGKVTDINPSL